ncbi:MAG: hypothetical protein WDN72_06300 [Alphaproteobacteria bacterium]
MVARRWQCCSRAPSHGRAQGLLQPAATPSAQDFIDMAHAPPEGEAVKNITVAGNQRIEASAIETYLGIGARAENYALRPSTSG